MQKSTFVLIFFPSSVTGGFFFFLLYPLSYHVQVSHCCVPWFLRCLLISFLLRPGQVLRNPCLIALVILSKFGVYFPLLTWTPWDPSANNIRKWCFILGADARVTLGSVPRVMLLAKPFYNTSIILIPTWTVVPITYLLNHVSIYSPDCPLT